MSKEMKENLAAAIRNKEQIIGNKQNYTLICPTYVLVAHKAWDFTLAEVMRHDNPTWTYSVFWKKHRSGVHMKSDPDTKASIRQAIAEKIHVPVDEIDPELHVNPRGHGSLRPVWNEHFAWESYTVGYDRRKLVEEVLFDQEKYDADLAIWDARVNAIMEEIKALGDSVDSNLI